MSVYYFGMKLNSPDPAAFVRRRGNHAARPCEDSEAGGNRLDTVAMAHPSLETARQPGEYPILFENLDPGLAKLPLVAGYYFPAHTLRGELESVTYAKHRDSQFEELRGK
jgi:hypothetical protein